MPDKLSRKPGVEQQLRALTDDVEKLRKKPRDAWDMVQVISAMLVPLAIAFAGIIFSQASKDAEIAIAEKNARVSQAQLISAFTEGLTSTEPYKRKIAVVAVSLALSDTVARQLVEAVKVTDPDSAVRAFASVDFAEVHRAVQDVIRSLQSYVGFTSDSATIEDAQRMLQSSGLQRITIEPEAKAVSAQVNNTVSITLWPGTYGKRNAYGVRYGTRSPKWDSQATYFEIVIPVKPAS
jgi:hypothetical protein